MERSQNDKARVNFEEIPEIPAAFAAAEAIRAQRGQRARHPLTDHIRQGLQIVGSGNENAGRIRKTLADVGYARFFAGVQTIQPLRLDAVAVERLVTRDAPDIGRDAVLLLENFLRAQSFVQNGSAAEKLCPQIRIRVRRGTEAVHALEYSFSYTLGHGRMCVVQIGRASCRE